MPPGPQLIESGYQWRAAFMPVGPVLKFAAQREQGILGERRSGQLQRNRKIAGESAGDRKRGNPGEISRRDQPPHAGRRGQRRRYRSGPSSGSVIFGAPRIGRARSGRRDPRTVRGTSASAAIGCAWPSDNPWPESPDWPSARRPGWGRRARPPCRWYQRFENGCAFGADNHVRQCAIRQVGQADFDHLHAGIANHLDRGLKCRAQLRRPPTPYRRARNQP